MRSNLLDSIKLSAGHNVVEVSSVLSPPFNSNESPFVTVVTFGKVPADLNSRLVPGASPTANFARDKLRAATILIANLKNYAYSLICLKKYSARLRNFFCRMKRHK